MRITLTLDDDVAALLTRLLRRRRMSLKKLVNEALRRGLRQLDVWPRSPKPFRIEPFEGTRCLLDNVDNIGEVLAFAEGEDYK